MKCRLSSALDDIPVFLSRLKKTVENTGGKRENAGDPPISPFPTMLFNIFEKNNLSQIYL